ncbi:TetR/AcrR family transcriptional regulator [Devosia sp.]|uniref:TetR/AcrR family transcriptional regulator n=1 Tax=Devosia sp. TaxID=1871048 RepID=UPI003A924108
MSSESVTTRARALDATVKLLEDQGPAAVRMADIARSAGISRQALYLHFPNRADLLVAATRHIDQRNDLDARLAPSRAATGPARLDAYIAFWADYLPLIAGVGRALIALADTDEAARLAWSDRMAAHREGCAAAIAALHSAGALAAHLTESRATDLLWMLLQLENWLHLTNTCGWSQADYLAVMQQSARDMLMKG